MADVRRFPFSRRHPQFNRERLSASLNEAGIACRWIEALGGRRDDDAAGGAGAAAASWSTAYLAHMRTPEFAQGLEELLALAESGRTAVLCAERDPRNCHRLLVADALEERGVAVTHVTGPGESAEHRALRSAGA